MTGKNFKAWCERYAAILGYGRAKWAKYAAERLCVSPRTIRRWAKMARIPKRVEKAL